MALKSQSFLRFSSQGVTDSTAFLEDRESGCPSISTFKRNILTARIPGILDRGRYWQPQCHDLQRPSPAFVIDAHSRGDHDTVKEGRCPPPQPGRGAADLGCAT